MCASPRVGAAGTPLPRVRPRGRRQVTPARAPARGARAPAGSEGAGRPPRAPTALPCRSGSSPGAPGRPARPRAARPPGAPRGTGGRPWRARRRRLRGQCLGGRRAAGGSRCERGCASVGGGPGAVPGGAPRPAPPRPRPRPRALLFRPRAPPGAGGPDRGAEVRPLLLAGPPKGPGPGRPPGESGRAVRLSRRPFPSRLSPPRVRIERSP